MIATTPYFTDPTKGITHDDVYKSFAKYGHNLISPIKLGDGKILAVEDLATEVLKKSEDIREVEGLTVVLANDFYSLQKLIWKSTEKEIAQKTGYICDITAENLGALEGVRLARTAEDLYPHKEDKEVPIINGVLQSLIDSTPKGELEKKWGISYGLDHHVIKSLLANRNI